MRSIHRRPASFSALALVAIFGTACAGTPETFIASGPGAGTVITDPMVADVLTTANAAQIEVSQLAVTKAETERVREFAQSMIEDHRNVGDRFTTLLRAEGITPTTWAVTRDLQQNSRRTLDALRTYDGIAFDREFMEHEVEMHRYLIRTIEDTLIPAAADNDLEAALRGLVPDLRSHLSEAERILDSID